MAYKHRYIRDVFLLLAGYFLGVTVCAQSLSAANVGDKVQIRFAIPPKVGEFRKDSVSGSIACTLTVTEALTGSYDSCLKLGALLLGIEFTGLQGKLSDDKRIPTPFILNPRIVNVSPSGMRTLLMPITAVQESGRVVGLQSYLVVVLASSGHVSSLQITGHPSEIADNLAFSSIKLGSPKQHVIDVLGLPSSVTDVPKVKGVLWDYAPFPFSVELVGGIVYSVRINSPTQDELRRGFQPLSSVPE